MMAKIPVSRAFDGCGFSGGEAACLVLVSASPGCQGTEEPERGEAAGISSGWVKFPPVTPARDPTSSPSNGTTPLQLTLSTRISSTYLYD